MSNHYECREHGVAASAIPAHAERVPWIEQLAEQHERSHAPTVTPGKWSIRCDGDGWWVARRQGPNGFEEVACLTWQQAHRIVAGVTLKELAGDAWTVRIFEDRVTLQEHGDPFMKQFPGPTAIDQALGFLRSIIADRARRIELATLRDKARAELDVIDDHLQHASARERAAS